MKLPDIYTDWKIVTGLALILLGAANWTIGLERTQTYSRMNIARTQPAGATDYRSFDELDGGAGGAAVLEPLTAEQRQASYTAARTDFYHAVFLAGRAMVLLGLLVALLGLHQRDSAGFPPRVSPPPDDARLAARVAGRSTELRNSNCSQW